MCRARRSRKRGLASTDLLAITAVLLVIGLLLAAAQKILMVEEKRPPNRLAEVGLTVPDPNDRPACPPSGAGVQDDLDRQRNRLWYESSVGARSNPGYRFTWVRGIIDGQSFTRPSNSPRANPSPGRFAAGFLDLRQATLAATRQNLLGVDW